MVKDVSIMKEGSGQDGKDSDLRYAPDAASRAAEPESNVSMSGLPEYLSAAQPALSQSLTYRS